MSSTDADFIFVFRLFGTQVSMHLSLIYNLSFSICLLHNVCLSVCLSFPSSFFSDSSFKSVLYTIFLSLSVSCSLSVSLSRLFSFFQVSVYALNSKFYFRKNEYLEYTQLYNLKTFISILKHKNTVKRMNSIFE